MHLKLNKLDRTGLIVSEVIITIGAIIVWMADIIPWWDVPVAMASAVVGSFIGALRIRR